MSFNDDFMDFIGFMTDGTGEWPDDDDMSDDEDEKKEYTCFDCEDCGRKLEKRFRRRSIILLCACADQ